jgi:hypothetical protein
MKGEEGGKGGILEHLSGFWNKAEASGASQGLVLVCALRCVASGVSLTGGLK